MNEPSLAQVTIEDQRRWSLHLHGRRIPASMQASVSELAELLSTANALYQQAQADAQAIRDKAYQEGLAAGRAAAQASMAQHLVDAQRAAQDYLQDHEQRLVRVATAMTRRIVQALPRESVMAELVTGAIRSLRAERYLRIRLHPDVALALQARQDPWVRGETDDLPLEIFGDNELGLYDCVAESELGRVYAGLDDQLEALEAAARGALVRDD